jgi:YD repeat-containing protein
MKVYILLFSFLYSAFIFSQNHAQKPIRFIFESEHDVIGNLDITSKKVKLYNLDNHVIYEADLFNAKELDETFYYRSEDRRLNKEMRIFSDENASGKVNYKYNEQGYLLEKTEYNNSNQLLVRVSMTYDKNGQIASKKRELKSETSLSIESDFIFEYNKEGKIYKKQGFENGLEKKKITYQYEYANLKIITHKIDDKSEEIFEIWEETLDNDGKRLEYLHKTKKDGQMLVKVDVKYRYDEYGNITSENIGDEKTKIKKRILFEYKYDSFGNWIERKELQEQGGEQQEVSLIKRQIEYYNAMTPEHPPLELDITFDLKGRNIRNSGETHVRINNNNGELAWVVRRQGKILYQVDEYVYQAGQLVKINHLNNSKKENAYTIISYNEKGKKTDESSYSFEDKLDEKTMYSYNEKGEIIRRNELFPDFSHEKLTIEISETMKYNPDGKLVEKSLLEYGSKYSLTYSYNEENGLIMIVQEPLTDDEEIQKEVFTYDKANVSVYKLFLGETDTPHETITYQYNSAGEIIKSSFFEQGRPYSMTEYYYF